MLQTKFNLKQPFDLETLLPKIKDTLDNSNENISTAGIDFLNTLCRKASQENAASLQPFALETAQRFSSIDVYKKSPLTFATVLELFAYLVDNNVAIDEACNAFDLSYKDTNPLLVPALITLATSLVKKEKRVKESFDLAINNIPQANDLMSVIAQKIDLITNIDDINDIFVKINDVVRKADIMTSNNLFKAFVSILKSFIKKGLLIKECFYLAIKNNTLGEGVLPEIVNTINQIGDPDVIMNILNKCEEVIDALRNFDPPANRKCIKIIKALKNYPDEACKQKADQLYKKFDVQTKKKIECSS